MESELGTIIRALSSETFRARLADASLAFGEISSLSDLSGHAALRRREVESSSGVDVSIPAHPVRRLGESAARSGTVPTVGSHTRAIRREFGSDFQEA